ncbi:nitrous oxide reductase accessory protein NosL [Bradyrhizobium sp. GCM10027634]|uniref:nitrous oxide reductase accessory protein NosL n=1 Tax=unclassified Bradyrhizobium TaxID=2631580 RepID=UPI00188B5967|nr:MULTISPECIES: nitrous oxide reductase accessory protein NosL [unclassified Bradyrhizobium]MDN5002173.1 nitrous oxide reductase accessory protein NosL [Bradyrhizobium sp. WYCCWR 12677]QOZ45577.1 copper resistance protein CopZ [Bradyrhizobium sp. CCBAU 53340]
MRQWVMACALLLPLALTGCNEKQAAKIPPPQRMTAEDIGHYCGMNVLEHPGPKGHIFVASLIEPVWFSSVRDTLAFTQLPDEPKDIQAIYVSDMAKAPSWDKPGPDNWVEARKALFVIESRVRSGMGGDEAVPFSDRGAAEKFAAENGGRIVGFDDVPRDYVLTSATANIDATSDATDGLPGERSKGQP